MPRSEYDMVNLASKSLPKEEQKKQVFMMMRA